MVWGAILRVRTLFLIPIRASASLGRSVSYRRLPPCITWVSYINSLGTLNLRGINDTTKRDEVVDIFKIRKVHIACLDGDEIEREGRGNMVWS